MTNTPSDMPRPSRRSSSRWTTAAGGTLATLGVVVAASMTWGEYTVDIPADRGGGVGEFSADGWAGRLLVFGLTLPNVLVVFASVIACWCCWLRALAIGGIPAALPALFMLYALGHTAAIAFVYLGPDARIGPGTPLSAACSVAMLTLLTLELIGRRPPA